MDEIDLNLVAEKYNNLSEIWSSSDKWHYKTSSEIAKFIRKVYRNEIANLENRILNAGSGGNNYGLLEKNMLHVDIGEKKICNKEHFLVANIEKLPLQDKTFDLVLCVGSVINYCDPMRVLEEFDRLLTSKSWLIIEFENSRSWEFIGTKKFNKKAAIITTFYNGNEEKLWVFSEKYILNLLKLNNFNVKKLKRFHLLSPLFYFLTKNENTSSSLIHLDKIVDIIPLIRRIASNVIILAQRA